MGSRGGLCDLPAPAKLDGGAAKSQQPHSPSCVRCEASVFGLGCLQQKDITGMPAPERSHTPADRDRARAWLRTLTRGTVVAATGATVAIGVVVSRDHPGASAGSAGTSSGVASTTSTTASPTTTTTTGAGTSGSGDATTTTTTPATTTTTTTAPTRTTSPAHVTSGATS